MIEGKVCNTCKEYKLYDNYYKDSKAPDGHKAKCKKCLKSIKQKHYQKNKEKYRKAYLEFIERNPNYHKKKVLIENVS